MINLYITHYNEKNPIRRYELEDSIYRNINNKYIDNIYVLYDEDIFISTNDKIKLVKIKNRSRFSDYIAVVNKVSSDTDINIISNTDIYFDDTINVDENKKLKLDNTVVCLSRWDFDDSDNPAIVVDGYCQDTWIFKGKIKQYDPKEFSFYNGIPGCDNIACNKFKLLGYNVLNIPYDIKSYHNHKSNVRNYSESDRLSGFTYLYVDITKLKG